MSQVQETAIVVIWCTDAVLEEIRSVFRELSKVMQLITECSKEFDSEAAHIHLDFVLLYCDVKYKVNGLMSVLSALSVFDPSSG